MNRIVPPSAPAPAMARSSRRRDARAAAWAALLGTTLLGRDESALVTLFRYADKLEGNRAAMWCFIMLCFTSVLAYFLGHTAVRWQRSYRLLREVHAG